MASWRSCFFYFCALGQWPSLDNTACKQHKRASKAKRKTERAAATDAPYQAMERRQTLAQAATQKRHIYADRPPLAPLQTLTPPSKTNAAKTARAEHDCQAHMNGQDNPSRPPHRKRKLAERLLRAPFWPPPAPRIGRIRLAAGLARTRLRKPQVRKFSRKAIGCAKKSAMGL